MKTALFALLAGSLAMAQEVDRIGEWKKLGRDSLIALATEKLQKREPTFDPREHDRVVVEVTRRDVLVRFGHSIRYLARKTAMKYEAYVYFVSGTSGSSIESNPQDYGEEWEEYSFFKWKDSDRKAVRFVIDAINRDDEVGDIPGGILPKGTHMVIREESGYYDVTVDSYSTHSFYKVKKGSGKIYDAGHKHYARDRDEVREFLE